MNILFYHNRDSLWPLFSLFSSSVGYSGLFIFSYFLKCKFQLFHDVGPDHIESSLLIFKSMDWFLYNRDQRHERVLTNESYVAIPQYRLSSFGGP